MKSITKNLILYATGLIVLTLAFRYSLSTMLQHRHFTGVWFVAAAYGISVFIIAWVFGKRDNLTLPLYDIGLRFHVTTYLICNAIAELWFAFGLQSEFEKIMVIHLTAIFWGVGLLIHFILYLVTRKHAIKGIKKSELFE